MINSTHDGINIAQEFQSGFGPLINGSYALPIQFQTDLQYLWELGYRKVQVAEQSTNGSVPIINLQDAAAKAAKEQGFQVTYGLIPPASALPGDWPGIFSAQTIHAQSKQADGSVDIYKLANEMENATGREQIVSISRTNNVVTIIMPRPTLLITGNHINFYCAASGNGGSPVLGISPNSFFQVTVVNSTTFTFPSTGSNGSQSGGVWIAFAPDTIIGMIESQAVALKNLGITMKLSNSCLQGNAGASAGDYWITQWINNYQGHLDYYDLNIYGTQGFPVVNTLDAYLADFKAEINQGLGTFGSKFRVTEWSANSQTTSVKPTYSSQLVYYQLQRQSFLQSLGIDNFLFCYRENAEGNVFAATLPYNTTVNQQWRDWWWQVIGGVERQPTEEIVFGSMTLISQLRTYPVEIVNSNTNFNYGENWQSGTAFYNQAQTATDLAFLTKIGVKKIRVPFGNYAFTDGVNAAKEGILQALAAGFYVIGVCADNAAYGKSTDAGWPAYVAAVEALASWAQTNGLSEFQVGNELDPSDTSFGGGLSNTINKIIALGAASKGIYSGIVSYAVAQDRLETSWEAIGSSGISGSLDRLGYNAYGDTLNNQNQTVDDVEWQAKINAMQTAFGSKLYLSEWNLPYTTFPFPVSYATQVSQLKARVAYLNSISIENYFFCYSWTANNDYYALLQSNGVYRPWTQALFVNSITRQVATGRTKATGRPVILIT